ncbi:MAG: hypothetical protein WCA09_01930 [Burkholderiales bacterium]
MLIVCLRAVRHCRTSGLEGRPEINKDARAPAAVQNVQYQPFGGVKSYTLGASSYGIEQQLVASLSSTP